MMQKQQILLTEVKIMYNQGRREKYNSLFKNIIFP